MMVQIIASLLILVGLTSDSLHGFLIPQSSSRLISPCSKDAIPRTEMSRNGIPDTTLFTKLKARSIKAANSMDILQRKYVQERRVSKRMDLVLTHKYLSNLHSTETDSSATLPNSENSTLILLHANRSLSIVQIYMEEILKDEKKNEDGRMEKEMTEAINDIYSVLCFIHTGLLGVGTESGKQAYAVKQEVPHASRINISSRSERFQRDYIVARSGNKILRKLSAQFASLLSQF